MNKLTPCLFLILTLLGCSNIGNTEPQSLKQGEIPIILFCSRPYQRMAGFNPDKEHAYHLGRMQVMQKVSGGYLITPDECAGDICVPALLYTNEELLQGEILAIYPQDRLQWAHYIGDIDYTTITGFKKRIHVYREYKGKVISNKSEPEQRIDNEDRKSATLINDLVTQTKNDNTPGRFNLLPNDTQNK